jgi:lysophospholipase L1-like esterase
MTAPYLDVQEYWVAVHERYNSIVRKVATENNVLLIDLVEIFRKREGLFIKPSTDQCHYNWEGSKIVAQAIADKIINEAGL